MVGFGIVTGLLFLVMAAVLELGDSVGMMDEKYLALYAIMDRMEGWE